MPRTIRPLADLLPRLDNPLSRREQAEVRAIHLALLLHVVVVQQEGALPSIIPAGGEAGYLFHALAPLAQVSPTVRQVRAIFDPLRYSRSWYRQEALRSNLRILKRAVARAADQGR